MERSESSVKRLDLVAIGEALVEFNHVVAEEYRLAYAGDALNSLFYASRIGLRTGFIATLGEDAFTDRLRSFIFQLGIDAGAVGHSGEHPNAVYFIHRDGHGEPTYTFHRKYSAGRQIFMRGDAWRIVEYASHARAFLFSAIALAVLERRELLIELVQSLPDDVTVFFDTNFRKSQWAEPQALRELLEILAPSIDHLLVTSTDDLGIYGERSIETALSEYTRLGYRKVVIRRGPLPTIGRAPDGIIEIPAVPGIVVADATGAGDSFNAGYIDGILKGESFATAVRRGNAIAACAIQELGGIARGFDVARSQAYERAIEEVNV